MFKKSLVNLLVVLSLLLSLGLGVASATPPAQEELSYTVKLGDNLWTLAEKYLGSGPAYRAIVMATNAKNLKDSSFANVSNPNLIHPGWKFLIPSAEEAATLMTAWRAGAAFKVGQVTDMGGIDDKSFNATVWKGFQDAENQLGVEGKFLESQQQADYAKNIQQFLSEDLDLIVTVGFLLGVDTAIAAIANPDVNFAIVDYAYPDCWPGATPGKDCGTDVELENVLGLTFATDEAAFLAGYLAAGMSKTGKVGTFGGIPIPPVTIFMKGCEAGVKYYNQVHGTSVELLGWDTAADDGLFTGNFESTDDGRRFAESLMDEGADVILPVAGPVGLGSAAACQERGTMLIGVDTDWYVSAPEFKETYLTSIVKRMDVAVFDAIKQVLDGTFAGGTYLGTLANNGVGISPYHAFDSAVPAALKAEIKQIQANMIAGIITVDGVLAGEAQVALGTEENPIIWSFVPSGEMERVAAGAEAVADLIYEETGLVIETNVATEYAGVIEAMCTDPPKAHMASLATFAYVLAADKGCAEAELVSVRFGSPTYNGQFIVRADSGITSVADLAGKTFCRVDPLSTSGWIIPMLTMRAEGIDPDTDLAEVVTAGSHDAVAAAVYSGDCDAGATYVDARTRIEADYPDVMEQVIVIAVTIDIPNDGVQYVTGFPRALRDRINAALLKIVETDEGKEALDTAYQWSALIEADDTFYDPFRQMLSASGLDIEELLD